jgi:C_GCAxxG_C_C family probable redox protein
MEKTKSDDAVNCFLNGFNCAQALFSTYCRENGLDKETALKIATSFGGGMAHTGETCGAVTGALMVIGLKYGKIKADDNTAKDRTYKLVQEFAEKFKEVNGSLNCTDLIGCDLSTEEGMQNALSRNLFRTVCFKYVRDAAQIVEKLLR